MNIEKIEKLADVGEKIDSFRREYTNYKLWGSAPDGDVKADKLLEWISNNLDLVSMALDIAKADDL